MRTVAFCEIDAKCRATLRRHWPGVPIYEDVRGVDAARLAADGVAVDAVAGGFPCQRFSRAARGRNNADDLWPEMLRIVSDLIAAGRAPRWVLAENVPGLGDRGVDRVCSDLERHDYTVWPFRLDTAPPRRHRGRERFIFVANANSYGEPRRAVDAEVAKLSQVSGRRWPDDPAPVGMDDGLPGRMDRLGQIGNSISPWVSEMFGRAIMAAAAT